MKTYFKHSHEKSTARVFYSLDSLNYGTSRVDFRQRIVQPSTKEQQRLLSSSSPRLQHVHYGKYGIKPIWPSDKSTCEKWPLDSKSSRNRWSSILSISSKSDRNQCIRSKSDLQKKFLLPSISSHIPFVNQEGGSILLLVSVSLLLLLLLLLVYVIYRRRSCVKIHDSKVREPRRQHICEDNLRSHEPFEASLPSVRISPAINEDSSVVSSPSSNSSNVSTSVSNSAKHGSSSAVKEDNDSKSPSSVVVHQQKFSADDKSKTKTIEISLLPKEETSKVPSRRRSRFETNEQALGTESVSNDNAPTMPVVVQDSNIHEHVIRDNYTSLEEINQAVKDVGLVHSQLIFGIDYTISNLETGRESFHGLSLHHIQYGLLNPYQNVITIIGRTLEKFDEDTLIPAFGFGDRSTLDRKVFPLRPDGSYCQGFRGVLEAYNAITPKVRMSGPTNFAPLIREAIKIVKKTGQYHILVIVADGQVTNERQTKDAIVEASNYPLSIVMVGVGDGPWDMMNEFDDSLPTRQFDNFQFVNYNKIVEASKNVDSTFALNALMEIPSQYAQIKKLGLLK